MDIFSKGNGEFIMYPYLGDQVKIFLLGLLIEEINIASSLKHYWLHPSPILLFSYRRILLFSWLCGSIQKLPSLIIKCALCSLKIQFKFVMLICVPRVHDEILWLTELCVFINKTSRAQGNLGLVAAAIQPLLFSQGL